MKLQELAIIFIIIILPISLLVSEFTKVQINTLNLQIAYDEKLRNSTYDAIKAYQLNEKNSSTSDLANSKIRDVEAAVNSFMTSVSTSFQMYGYKNEDINNYVPALLFTLYDGFYIYSAYDGMNFGLKPYINYSMRYKAPQVDVVITYSLDNFINVRGMVDGSYVNKSGYLISNITVSNDSEIKDKQVRYNNVIIPNEILKEEYKTTPANPTRPYIKKNGTKFYYYQEGGEEKIEYILNQKIMTQSTTADPNFDTWKKEILNNTSAKKYYIEAKEFTDWFYSTSLKNLEYSNSYGTIIDSGNNVKADQQIWPGKNVKIFGSNPEYESSSFNIHRSQVIRQIITTNLSLAISNFTNYSGMPDNTYAMPDLKETEWQQVTENISMISFLQGLNIGTKKYNGYSIVTNSESKEVVLEENLCFLGNDGIEKVYFKMGDKKASFDVNNLDPKYGAPGRINTDFDINSLVNYNGTKLYYYYPIPEYNASYNSVVMQKDMEEYEDIYKYVNSLANDGVKSAFYTALGRERYSKFNFNK